MKHLTIREATDLVYGDAEYDEDAHDAIANALIGHLGAGKGVAVFQNQDMGHRDQGLALALTFGTPAAQFEGDESTVPERLPDGLATSITGGIGWRYALVGVVPQATS